MVQSLIEHTAKSSLSGLCGRKFSDAGPFWCPRR